MSQPPVRSTDPTAQRDTGPDRRVRGRVAALVGVAVLAATLFLAPGLSLAQLREVAASAGPAMPIALFGMYAIGTALPLPRTAFSLASGVLLGTTLGLAVAVAATATAAVLGFLLARHLGGPLVARYTDHRWVREVDSRITTSGLVGVASLRLIPVIPFAPLSYCCGMSSLRATPYVLGSVLGSIPGTAAVVLLGDALTKPLTPALAAWYGALFLVGALGVYRMVRR